MWVTFDPAQGNTSAMVDLTMPAARWMPGAHAYAPGLLGGVLVATFFPQPYTGSAGLLQHAVDHRG